MQIQIYPLKAFSDNYIWIIRHDKQVVVVDPGQAEPVLHHLQTESLELVAILITHYHQDHAGGVVALKEKTQAPVYGSAIQAVQGQDHSLKEGDVLDVFGHPCSVLEVPGHTMGHLAYVLEVSPDQKALFCGDTLFSCGSGRLFEGDSKKMVQSIDKFKELGDNTLVYSAHEYTLNNIRWALCVEPHNPDLQAWSHKAQALQDQGLPTLPTLLGQERLVNPFLRVRQPSVIEAAQAYAHTPLSHDWEVFGVLREWKNNF